MHCTDDLKGTLPSNQASKTHGKQEDNVSKTTRIHYLNNRGLGKLHLIPQLPQNLGIINLCPWTSTKQEPHKGTGEDKKEDNQGEMSPELRTFKPREEYRVHALTADNKDISLTTALSDKNAPKQEQPS